ncbi:MAG TPA: DUF3343 domain-containing protein [Syntrophomonadaceae bacterium]|nr:DUF3343 domain-containing protein [Syntrophomonadaceae bacterium]
MEGPDYNWYILFPNHHEGLRLSSELKRQGIKYTIAPTPRSVSTCCGISLIIEEKDLDFVKKIIANLAITIEKIAKVLVKKNWPYKSC